jgi:tetratricopeptide (TPR) repeat protein
MKEYRRIFLSYAKSDASDAQAIADDMKRQGFEVWDYAQQWKKGDQGYPPPDEFVELMQRATWFVPIVSTASVNPSSGKYAVIELEYALELDLIIEQRIVPLCLSGSRPKKWLKPYDVLEPLDVVKIDREDTRAYLQGIARLCRRLNVSYKPVLRDRPLLPFWRGFTEEIEIVRKKTDNAWELMPMMTEFDRCRQGKNRQEALDLIAHFLLALQYGRSFPPLFYSWIVKAHCEIEAGHYAAAAESIQCAARVNPDNPDIQGTKGYLHLRQKEYHEARECFSAALTRCEARDLMSMFHYLYPLIELGDTISIDNRRLILETDPSSWPDEGLPGLLNAGEILHYQSGEYGKAIELFASAGKKNLHDTTSVVYAHLSYLKRGDPAMAETTLISAIRDNGANPRISIDRLYYCLAEQYLLAEDYTRTLPIYEQHLLRPEMITRQYAIRHAQILRKLGDKKRMKTGCLRMLGGQFPCPKCCEDFYYDGFAWYLLGNTERAKYDFERSRQFDRYYSRCE